MPLITYKFADGLTEKIDGFFEVAEAVYANIEIRKVSSGGTEIN